MANLRRILLLPLIMIITARCQRLSTNKEKNTFAAMELTCTDKNMRVIMNLDNLNARTTASIPRPWTVGFYGDATPGCKVDQSNKTNQVSGVTTFAKYIWLDASLPNGCGMNELESSDYIIYNHTIVVTYGNHGNAVVRREEYDHYNVQCLRNRTVSKEIAGKFFNTTYRETGVVHQNKMDAFDITVTHGDKPNSKTTRTYTLGEKIMFTVKMSTSLTTVKMVPQSCWSTTDGVNKKYKLLDNGCPVDAGTTLNSSTNHMLTFSTAAYRYLGEASSSIYVECLIKVCLNTTVTEECRSCVERRKPARKRRAIGETDESKLHMVRSSIFYIIDPTDKSSGDNDQQESTPTISGTSRTIIIVLLVLMIFIVAVAVVKKVFFNEVPVLVPNISLMGMDNKAMT